MDPAGPKTPDFGPMPHSGPRDSLGPTWLDFRLNNKVPVVQQPVLAPSSTPHATKLVQTKLNTHLRVLLWTQNTGFWPYVHSGPRGSRGPTWLDFRLDNEVTVTHRARNASFEGLCPCKLVQSKRNSHCHVNLGPRWLKTLHFDPDGDCFRSTDEIFDEATQMKF